jgi:hypothetical protein
MIFKNTSFFFNKRLFLSLSFLSSCCTFVRSIETNNTYDLNHALMNKSCCRQFDQKIARFHSWSDAAAHGVIVHDRFKCAGLGVDIRR